MISSSYEAPKYLHLFNTQSSLSSSELNFDSNSETKKIFQNHMLLSPLRSQQNPNKKIVLDDGSWLKRAVSLSSETTSPERQFERQEFFNQFRVPINFCEETIQQPKLEHITRNAINFINPETLYQNRNEITLFDCRYGFEFNGGHIQGATHLSNPFDLQPIFFNEVPPMKQVVVLYCEFSEKRSLRMYNQIRNMDRNLNDYPNLYYPDLYVLDKGFSNYQLSFPIQGSYIQMADEVYKIQYKEQKQENENQWNQLKIRKSKSRMNI